MKHHIILFLTLLVSKATLAQKEIKPTPEKMFYKYTYGGSLGYYFVDGVGVNLTAQYNFNKYVSVGAMLYKGKPDPTIYNYLGQRDEINNTLYTSYDMNSSGVLGRLEINAFNSRYIALYGAVALGFGYSSYSYTYEEYRVVGSFPNVQTKKFIVTNSGEGSHLNYSADIGVKVHAGKQLDLFGETGFGTAFLKVGALWNM